MNKKVKERLEEEFVKKTPFCKNGCTITEINYASYDHIIPKILLEMFGFDTRIFYDEENGQVLCFRCNQYKAHKLDFLNPKTIVLLEKYLKILKEGGR